MWSQNPDLIRKNDLFDADNNIAGGVYLKAHAEKWHGAESRAKLKQLYGADLTSQFFDAPIVADKLAGKITTSLGESADAWLTISSAPASLTGDAFHPTGDRINLTIVLQPCAGKCSRSVRIAGSFTSWRQAHIYIKTIG